MDPTAWAALIAFLAFSGILAGIAAWIWKLEPRLQTLENEQGDQGTKIEALRNDHNPRISQNERDIAQLKNQLGVIDVQVKHNGAGIDRILTKLDK